MFCLKPLVVICFLEGALELLTHSLGFQLRWSLTRVKILTLVLPIFYMLNSLCEYISYISLCAKD